MGTASIHFLGQVMRRYYETIVVSLVLTAVFLLSRPSMQWNAAPAPTLTARFVGNQYLGSPMYVIVFANERVHRLFTDVEAREYADSLDSSQHGLRWQIYIAADDYARERARAMRLGELTVPLASDAEAAVLAGEFAAEYVAPEFTAADHTPPPQVATSAPILTSP